MITAKIDGGPYADVYKGYAVGETRRPCLIKYFHLTNPSISNLAKIKQTYKNLQRLSSPGVLPIYDVLEQPNGLVLVSEARPLLTLKSLLESGPVPLDLFLQIGSSLASTLQELHQHNIIHGSIKPSNVLLDPDTYQPKLWDIGVFSLLVPAVTFYDPHFVASSLPYISPEQSGRWHRTADYRTDLYSLGITFYEMLAGHPPFLSTDPLQIIHSHLARNPRPLPSIVPDVPQSVADIVLKLLVKEPEGRYQSGRGVHLDIEHCRRQLSETGAVTPFKLGQFDRADKFLIPQRVYGREPELALLRRLVDAVAYGRTEIALVTGEAGIGKSTLVREVDAWIVRRQGFFIAGKYEQLKRNKAYDGILQAIRNLVWQLLNGSEDQIATWRQRLTLALGRNAAILIDLVPEMGLLLGSGSQPDESLPVNPNQLNLLFEQLINELTAEGQPLVIYLDDLQWADAASMDLIRHLIMAQGTHHTLLITALRDDELQAAHPLPTVMRALQKADLSVHTIHLSALDLETVNKWIAETFALAPDVTGAFSAMVYQKTGGNPFFIKLFLQTLYEEGILTFDGQVGWQWDLQRSQQLGVTANVVKLMVQRIGLLPAPAQLVLTAAACIGNEFTLDTLAAVAGQAQENIYLELEPAITNGMILQSGAKSFRFAHDRVHQAVYSLLPAAQKQTLHWQIGQYWLAQHQPADGDDKLFDVVNQLNLGRACFENQADCLQLVLLNVEAARKAKMSAAYQTAYEYAEAALALSQNLPDGWGTHHESWLDLYNEAIETAYLSGHLAEMEQLIPVLLSQASTILEKQKTIEIQIQARLSQSELPEAIDIGLEALAALGLHLPRQPTQADFEAGYQKIQALLGGREIETLIDLPPMQDPPGLMAMRILSAISTAVWSASSTLYALDVFKRVELSLTLGNAPTSAAAYAGLGVILCSRMGEVAAGHRFGQLALKICDEYPLNAAKARTLGTVYCFTFHWQKPLRDSVQPSLEGHHIGIETGDFSFASSNAYLYVRHAYFSGHNLTVLSHRINTLSRTVRQLKQMRAANMLDMYQQICLNWQQETAQPYCLVGPAFDENEVLPLFEASQDKNRISTLLCNKLILAYFFEAYDEAMRLSREVEKRADGLSASIYLPLFHFYDSLTRLALFSSRDTAGQERILARVSTTQKQLHHWADNAPMNFRHKWLLVAAEEAAARQQFGQAREYYDEAIALAREHRYLQEEGLANELAAKFYRRRGQDGLAHFYAQAAMACYGRWGATAKQKAWRQTMPHLFEPHPAVPTGLSNEITDTAVENILDYASVLKATRIISEEIVLEKLSEKLMRIVIENAGAQTGYLILPRNGILKIEAAATVDSEGVNLCLAEPVDANLAVPTAIINHVAQTGETVLLHHAASEGAFTHDPTIIANQTKSVLCMMIQRQNELLGILYLENNLTTRAFTEARIELLQTLLSQAAISLQNALYYESLKQEVEERKLAETRLRASEAEWRSLVDNAPDNILIVTRDMRVRFVNRLLPPLRKEDVIGKLIYDFVLPEDRDTVKKSIRFVFKHGTHTEYESSGPGADGQTAWYSTRLGPIFQDGEVIGVTMVATDITKRREVENKLRLYMAELERSNRELQEFAYVSSHDLQEPLRKIQTFGDRLEVKYQDALDERGLDYLRRMQNAASRMQTLIEDLLAFSRVTTRALPFKQIDLNKVMQNALLNLELQLEQTGGRVYVARLHQIEADESQMLQLFQNLISNSLKFHRPGVPPVVHIADELIDGRKSGAPLVRITVEDNGIGFEEKYADRIFGVFQRLHGRDTYEGTGVGLAICRKITDRHQGQISAVSHPDRGTKITVSLPQTQSRPAEAQPATGER